MLFSHFFSYGGFGVGVGIFGSCIGFLGLGWEFSVDGF